jgi:hypothetical protein
VAIDTEMNMPLEIFIEVKDDDFTHGENQEAYLEG